MKLIDLYRTVVELGRKNDPRPFEEVTRTLELTKEQYEELKNEEKKFFDLERLTNPYNDTRILNGDPEQEVSSVLVGIDMEAPEIVLADRLREKGEKIDLVLSHHPEGKALAALHRVMHMQEDILAGMGIPINVAEGILTSRISEVERNLMPLNHNRAVDAARLLGFPLMCVHTPADNMVNTFLTHVFEEKAPETLGDVVEILRKIPEYQRAMETGSGPKIVVGSEKRRAGKIFVDMTGGTGGPDDAFLKLSVAGVGTVVGMHISEKNRKAAEKNHVNVIIAGHMASDSLGMNLVLDYLEQKGVKFIPCSGLTRVSRN